MIYNYIKIKNISDCMFDRLKKYFSKKEMTFAEMMKDPEYREMMRKAGEYDGKNLDGRKFVGE